MTFIHYIREFIEFTWPLTVGLGFLVIAVIAAVSLGVFSISVTEFDDEE